MVFRNAHSFGRFSSRPPCADAASSGKLIWMSAALNAGPANHSRVASSDSMKSRRRLRFGRTMMFFAVPEILRAIGRTKNGIGLDSMRSKISLSSSGGIMEPSAKCIQ